MITTILLADALYLNIETLALIVNNFTGQPTCKSWMGRKELRILKGYERSQKKVIVMKLKYHSTWIVSWGCPRLNTLCG